MRWLLVLLAAAGMIGLGFSSKKSAAANSKKITELTGSYAPVAVLELFTSEGCSNCPAAEKLLPELAKIDDNIITLSFHVDYWNKLGWTDVFSSPDYTERQKEYSTQLKLESIYTPQLVVNGEYELVGSDRSEAEAAIRKVLKENTKVKLDIADVKLIDNKLHFSVQSDGNFNKTNILAVLIEKEISVDIKAGENHGIRLPHTNVVRTLAMQTAVAKNDFELKIPAELSLSNCQLVVYTQQKNDLKITGAVLYNPN